MSEGERGELAAEQGAELLRIARQAVAARAARKPPPVVRTEEEALRRKGGAFVTIKRGKELRGCVGVVEARMALAEAVAHAAASAASEDYRFEPVAEHELAELRMEVSVLSAPEPVPDPEQIEIGKHGLIAAEGPNRGLLLPQVAVEWGWGREEFLEHVCLKAGLDREAWKKGARLYWFTAQVFSEEAGGGVQRKKMGEGG